MATRSRRRRGGSSRTSAVRKSFNDAQKTIGAYAKKGGKQVNTAVTSFLSRFDAHQLLDALKKKTGMSGRRSGSARRSSARGRRVTTRGRSAKRAAAARAKGAGRKRSRRR